MINVKILADNICNDIRVTTFELEYPRYIHSELKTHRVFTTNSASSRAIPLKTMCELIRSNPVIPHWTYNKRGMSGDFVIDEDTIKHANECWFNAMNYMLACVNNLEELGIHKQNANRLLEPFQHIKTVLTGVEFENFFKLRISPYAQPEICELARKMKDALSNEPSQMASNYVHCPYTENGQCHKDDIDTILTSVARCAQVSYRKEDSSPETVKRIVDNLIGHENIHASPFEHICLRSDSFKGNLNGYRQLRHCIEKCIQLHPDSNCYEKIKEYKLWDIF